MSGWLDGVLVGAALLVSVLYASTVLGPKRWRARFWAALAERIFQGAHTPGRRWLAQRVAKRAARAEAACGSGCGGCGDAPVKPPGSASAAEVRVPLARLTRRGVAAAERPGEISPP